MGNLRLAELIFSKILKNAVVHLLFFLGAVFCFYNRNCL